MAHYFDEKTDLEHQERVIETRLHGIDFHFKTDRGVFSRTRLDYGSELLLTTVIQVEGHMTGRVLDLGCGYGPVGIVLKRIFPALNVVLADVNERALELARHNARLNQTQYVEIVQSDGLTALTGDFDVILTNPPIRAGKAVVYRFFIEASTRLRTDGRLYVVIQKKQGAPSALARLQTLFADVSVLERSAGYWIIRARSPMLRASKEPV